MIAHRGPAMGFDLRTRIPITKAAVVALAALVATITVGCAQGAGHPSQPGYVGGTAKPNGPDINAARTFNLRLWVLSNGILSNVSLSAPEKPRTITSQECERVYAAAGTVACLRPVDVFVATRLVIFDSGLRERRSISLNGFPNLTRVSPSGRMVAWTLFVDKSHHRGTRAAPPNLFPHTGIFDTRTGQTAESLNDFAATVDGRPYQATDITYSSVTFIDDNRFYASMSTGDHHYLVEGDFAAKTVRTLTDNIECPSLSPDGTRIAFLAAVGGDPEQGWRLSVLDVATKQITPLAETRSVDDQATWLDDNTIAYGIQRSDGINDVWAVPADGTGKPWLLVPEANSPSVMN
jgi:hypothetical protein